MDPDVASAWLRILRDFVIVAVGSFILVHETLTGDSPNPYLIAAGLSAFGLPPVLRLDDRRRKNGNGSG